jgi:hypothetical protein
MDRKRLISSAEIITGTALFIFITYGLYLKYSVGKEGFVNFVREDGPVEYLTTIFLFF